MFTGQSVRVGVQGKFGRFSTNDWWIRKRENPEQLREEQEIVKRFEEELMQEALGVKPKRLLLIRGELTDEQKRELILGIDAEKPVPDGAEQGAESSRRKEKPKKKRPKRQEHSPVAISRDTAQSPSPPRGHRRRRRSPSAEDRHPNSDWRRSSRPRRSQEAHADERATGERRRPYRYARRSPSPRDTGRPSPTRETLRRQAREDASRQEGRGDRYHPRGESRERHTHYRDRSPPPRGDRRPRRYNRKSRSRSPL